MVQITERDHLFEYLIRLADDHFILSHRLSEWCGHGPMLEEDLALSNIALDLIGQARNLYTYAGDVEGKGRDEDALAFLRREHEYHNLMLVEQPNGDFAHTIVRQLFFSLHAELLWHALGTSNDKLLAQIAQKARKEAAYHVRHSAQWLIRLGDGTEESAARTVDAVVKMAPLASEMFDADPVTINLVEQGIVPDPAELQHTWDHRMKEYFTEARIEVSLLDVVPVKGARQGRHSEAMGHILAQVQYMQRTYPGCQW